MQEIYLDNSATTRPLPRVLKYMKKTLISNYGNPSSLHRKGLEAEKLMKKCRKKIGKKLKVKPSEIYFTSGGTESNNIAIKGAADTFKQRGRHLITSQTEHPSVLNVFKTLEKKDFEVTYLSPDKNGIISLKKLKKAVNSETILVSLMHVNNEIGNIQPVPKAGPIIKQKNPLTLFHVDAVQSFGKIYINPEAWNIDMLSLSGHKIHGPKGIGALFIKNGIELQPLFNGGGQEDNQRSGTENIPGIAGLIPAIENLGNFSPGEYEQSLQKNKQYLLHKLENSFQDIRINTPTRSAPHILNISFPGIKGEVLVHALEEENIYISTGSACSSRSEKASNVLKAIQVPQKYREGTVRISLSEHNTKKEIDFTMEKLKEKVDYLKI